MDDTVKIRYDLIRIYAELDKEYQQLLSNAHMAEDRLHNLEKVIPADLAASIHSVITSCRAVDQRMTELACTYLIIRAEAMQDYPQSELFH